jgi:hypothetical protein
VKPKIEPQVVAPPRIIP